MKQGFLKRRYVDDRKTTRSPIFIKLKLTYNHTLRVGEGVIINLRCMNYVYGNDLMAAK